MTRERERKVLRRHKQRKEVALDKDVIKNDDYSKSGGEAVGQSERGKNAVQRAPSASTRQGRHII